MRAPLRLMAADGQLGRRRQPVAPGNAGPARIHPSIKNTGTSAGVVALAATMLSMPSAASDSKEEQLMIAGENGAAIRPQLARLAPDGSIVFAGDISAANQSWAAKINADLSIAWTYTGALSAQDRDGLRNTMTRPEFNDAVPLPDGSVFLCGKMPYSPQSRQSTALLTHLDPHGSLISERLVDIEDTPESALRYSIDACTSSSGGVLALAHESHFPRPGAKPDAFAASFALLQFDAAGNIKWKQRFSPVAADFSPAPGAIKLLVLRDAIVAIATDNRSTDVAAFSLDGKPTARKHLMGRYVHVQGGASDDRLRLDGSSEIGGAGLKTMMTFNGALDELGKVSGTKPAAFVPNVIFELRDHAFAMFGTQVNAAGERLTSAIRRVGKNLADERPVEIPHHGFFDGGAVLAASPTATQGVFAIARPYAPPGATPDVRRGALIDVIQFYEGVSDEISP